MRKPFAPGSIGRAESPGGQVVSPAGGQFNQALPGVLPGDQPDEVRGIARGSVAGVRRRSRDGDGRWVVGQEFLEVGFAAG
jgi:hypothetical protein